RSARGPDRQRVEAWTAWATMLAGQGKRDEALRVLEEAAGPEAAGDHAALRIARASLLLRAGQGQAAREALSSSRDRLPRSEQAEVSRALATLCQELGDRDAARAALLDWARQAPESPEPGLSLLDLSRLNGDEEAARLGMEI